MLWRSTLKTEWTILICRAVRNGSTAIIVWWKPAVVNLVSFNQINIALNKPNRTDTHIYVVKCWFYLSVVINILGSLCVFPVNLTVQKCFFNAWFAFSWRRSLLLISLFFFIAFYCYLPFALLDLWLLIYRSNIFVIAAGLPSSKELPYSVRNFGSE